MTEAPANFDRIATLPELLRAVPRERLQAALDRTIGGRWRIVDADGETVWENGKPTSDPEIALQLTVGIDVVGRLVTSARQRQQAGLAVQWLDIVLASALRYQMAADLHLEAVHADYEALEAKHAALQASEDRYRILAEELERRVQAQVSVIEHAQRKLFQSAQMAAIGSLAAGMAHEINNPIGFIRSNLGTAASHLEQLATILVAFRRGDAAMAQADWARSDIDYVMADFGELLSESAAGADRIARIVSSLKAFACVDRAVGPTDLNEAVRAASSLVREQLPDGISLNIDLQPLPLVPCDLARMNHALFALLQNAQQACEPGGGAIHISTAVAGDGIRIAVRDNGCGMAETVRGRVFEPFFTTRGVGGGMGMGLTVAHDIVRAHQGRIEVESAIGAGSTLTVCLPWSRPEDMEMAR